MCNILLVNVPLIILIETKISCETLGYALNFYGQGQGKGEGYFTKSKWLLNLLVANNVFGKKLYFQSHNPEGEFCLTFHIFVTSKKCCFQCICVKICCPKANLHKLLLTNPI